VQDDILEEGDAFVYEDSADLDDLEMSLDMEASAEVDDAKVLKGMSLEDNAAGGDLEADEQLRDTADVDEFALDDIDFDFAEQEVDQTVAPASNLEKQSVDVEFDLSADDENANLEFDTDGAIEKAPELTAAPAKADSSDEEDNLLDFDFDLSVDEDDSDISVVSAVESLEASKDTPAGNEVDFDFSVVEDEPVPVAAPPVAAPGSQDYPDEEVDFDFDAEIFDLDVEEEAVPPAETAVAPADDLEDLQFVDETLLDSIEKTAVQFSDSDDDGFEYLSDTDEAATKLDLARAYYEMGDSAGAREILEEVLREGNDDQVMDARDLLSKL